MVRAREAGARLSIGALSRATGIPIETLRTWESRYGYPVPERKPSGHRVYAMASVPRLRRMTQALARGHRAGQVVMASDADLVQLLEATPDATPPPRTLAPPVTASETLDVTELLKLVEGFEAERLTRVLLGDWARLGPLPFLETRVAPLVRGVGEAWESGRFEVRHEHFLSERIGDLLRSLCLPFEERAHGPLVILASLPGETHALGLQMAALTLSSSGCRVLFLGTETPAGEMVTLSRHLGACAVALSVSRANKSPALAGQIRQLRAALPKRVRLLVGGDGAPRPTPGVEVISRLAELLTWGQRAIAEQPSARHASA